MIKYLIIVISLMLLQSCSTANSWTKLFNMLESATINIDDQPAPDFEFTGYNGEQYALSDYAGKIVVLNFWASWCAPCILEASIFNSLHQQYSSNDVIFLGLSFADFEPAAIEFTEIHDVTYATGPDTNSHISDAYGVNGIPETFIIDRNGKIAYHFTSIDEATLGNAIDQLLSEQ